MLTGRHQHVRVLLVAFAPVEDGVVAVPVLAVGLDPAVAYPLLPKPLGLSSLEYDPVHRCLWLLTSYEKDGKLDAYVWTNTLADLNTGKPFRLVRSRGGRPLTFGHKAEDITLLNNNQLLIIHDDDRVQTVVGKRTRQSNQAAYTIITLN